MAAAMPLSLLLLIPLLLLWKRRRDRKAAEALELWRERQRRGVVKPDKRRKAGKQREENRYKSAYRKRLLRFLLLSAAQEAISRRRDRVRRQLPESRLVRRLSAEQEGED